MSLSVGLVLCRWDECMDLIYSTLLHTEDWNKQGRGRGRGRLKETRGGGSQDPFLATFAFAFATPGLLSSSSSSTDSSAHVGITRLLHGSLESSVQVSVWDPPPPGPTVKHNPTRSEKWSWPVDLAVQVCKQNTGKCQMVFDIYHTHRWSAVNNEMSITLRLTLLGSWNI